MRVLKYIIIILVFAGSIWYFIGSIDIAGTYTDGFHTELDIPKSEVIKLLKETPYYIDNSEELAKFCYDNSLDSNKTYLYFKYSVKNIEYLHVSFVATSWDNKTLLVYYNIVGDECKSEPINDNLKNKKLFINKFKENIIARIYAD